MNIHGVFLHVLGDALGSVGVVLSGIFIKYTKFSWRFVADPVCSLAIILMICIGTKGLLQDAIHILLQNAPRQLDTAALRKKLLKVDRVLGVHCFHVWQLTNKKNVASVHIIVSMNTTPAQFMATSDQIKRILHKANVHATTVQPEYVTSDANARTSRLEQCHEPLCSAEEECLKRACCDLGADLANAI